MAKQTKTDDKRRLFPEETPKIFYDSPYSEEGPELIKAAQAGEIRRAGLDVGIVGGIVEKAIWGKIGQLYDQVGLATGTKLEDPNKFAFGLKFLTSHPIEIKENATPYEAKSWSTTEVVAFTSFSDLEGLFEHFHWQNDLDALGERVALCALVVNEEKGSINKAFGILTPEHAKDWPYWDRIEKAANVYDINPLDKDAKEAIGAGEVFKQKGYIFVPVPSSVEFNLDERREWRKDRYVIKREKIKKQE